MLSECNISTTKEIETKFIGRLENITKYMIVNFKS